MKKEGPIGLAIVVALIMLVEYFFDVPTIASAAATLRNWVVLITTLMLPLGAINLVRVQLPNVRAMKPGWIYSATILVFMALSVVLGISKGTATSIYRLFINQIVVPAGNTIYSLLAFFIASAAYRSFRFRNLDSSVLLIAALIAMIGNAPIGGAISSFFPNASQWITNIPNTAGQRGLIITAALGFVSTCLRNIVGYNRQWLGGSKN